MLILIISIASFTLITKNFKTEENKIQQTQNSNYEKNEKETSLKNESTIIIKEIKNTGFVCNTPYIVNGNSCCLDNNNNKICDKDENLENTNEENKNSDNYFESVTCGDGFCSEEEKNNCCFDCGCKIGKICTSDNECINANYSLENTTNETVKINLTLLGFSTEFESYKKNDSKNEQYKRNNTQIVLSNNGTIKLDDIFYENLSTTDYIVVTIDYIKLTETFDRQKCDAFRQHCSNDYVSEIMFYSQAYTQGEELQKVVFPLGRAKEVPIVPLMQPGYVFQNPLPIFSIEKDYLKNPIIINILVSDADKKTVLQKINYDTTFNEVKEMFSNKNDLLIQKTITLNKQNNYNIGTHYFYDPTGFIEVKYTVREIKVPYDIPVTVKLKRIEAEDTRDVPSNSNPAEPILWYRVAENIVPDEFGVSTEYDTKQNFGSRELEPFTADRLWPYTKDFENFVLYSTDSIGPFLTIELDLYDRDTKCKDLGINPYVCANTDKLQEIQSTLISFTLDNPAFFSMPKEKRTFYIIQDGFEVEITRGAYE